MFSRLPAYENSFASLPIKLFSQCNVSSTCSFRLPQSGAIFYVTPRKGCKNDGVFFNACVSPKFHLGVDSRTFNRQSSLRVIDLNEALSILFDASSSSRGPRLINITPYSTRQRVFLGLQKANFRVVCQRIWCALSAIRESCDLTSPVAWGIHIPFMQALGLPWISYPSSEGWCLLASNLSNFMTVFKKVQETCWYKI